MQTHGVYRDAPTCPTGPTGQTGQTPAPHRRSLHTTVAIKQAMHTPAVNLPPASHPTAACTPTGYPMTHQLVRQVRQVRQVRHKRHTPAVSHTAVAITLPAYPGGISSPAPNQTAACKPPGYTVARPSCPLGPSGPPGP